jgi:hypothetical protein
MKLGGNTLHRAEHTPVEISGNRVGLRPIGAALRNREDTMGRRAHDLTAPPARRAWPSKRSRPCPLPSRAWRVTGRRRRRQKAPAPTRRGESLVCRGPAVGQPGRRPAVGISDRSQRGRSILRRFRNDSVSRGRRIVAGEGCPALKRKAPPIADGGATARSVVRLERIHVGSKYDRLRQQRALSDPGTSRLTLS